jgi:hypothetical protein
MWRRAFRIERRAEEEPACLAHDFVRRIRRCIRGGTTAKSTAAVLRRCTRSRGKRITTSTQQAGTAAAGRGRGQGSGRGQGEGVLASFCVVQLVAQPDALIQELRERRAQPSLLCGTTVEAKTCRGLKHTAESSPIGYGHTTEHAQRVHRRMSTGAQEGMDRTCSMNAAKSLEMAACRAPSSLKRLRALLLILPAARAAPTDHRYRLKPTKAIFVFVLCCSIRLCMASTPSSALGCAG